MMYQKKVGIIFLIGTSNSSLVTFSRKWHNQLFRYQKSLVKNLHALNSYV